MTNFTNFTSSRSNNPVFFRCVVSSCRNNSQPLVNITLFASIRNLDLHRNEGVCLFGYWNLAAGCAAVKAFIFIKPLLCTQVNQFLHAAIVATY